MFAYVPIMVLSSPKKVSHIFFGEVCPNGECKIKKEDFKFNKKKGGYYV